MTSAHPHPHPRRRGTTLIEAVAVVPTTFLILARRAGSIRDRAVLSSWLYGVAHKVATRCRSEVLRRRSHETTADVIEFQSRPRPGCLPSSGPSWTTS